ncbi:MAG TPA: DNA-processing protein DprA [Natronosporangium sp.]
MLERGSAAALLAEQLVEHDALLPAIDLPDQLIAEAAAQLAEWEAAGFGVHTVLDDSYPPQLREIRELPPVIFTRGRLVDDTRAIAVVGSRKASDRGLRIARVVAETLAKQSITVVSGLAVGIDTAAHEAALRAGGRTVAVIGTGIRRYYPAANRELQQRIAFEGLVVSQFWPDAPPRRQHFPMRNAVMSGYAAATVVVEAGEHSGARTQARLAVQHGRPVVLLSDLLNHEWAQTLAAKPGVTVAAGPDELFAVIDELLRQRAAELSPTEGVADLVIAQ